jgi:hypothetical protein
MEISSPTYNKTLERVLRDLRKVFPGFIEISTKQPRGYLITQFEGRKRAVRELIKKKSRRKCTTENKRIMVSQNHTSLTSFPNS